MGLFSQYAGGKAVALDSGVGVARSPVDRGAGRRLWREIFGTEKETGGKGPGERQEPIPSGGWGRSSIAGQAATKRLLEAFRSMAPGGWSDDRWEQTKHFEGIQYVCFPPGTRVRMADGTHKSIEEVKLDEKVLTAEGNLHSVKCLFKRDYKGDLVKLCLWGHRHLKMTPNHEVLTKRGYVPAEDLTREDWVAIPRYLPERRLVLDTVKHVGSKFRRSLESPTAYFREVPEEISLTPEFGRILGLYLAEAHTTDSGEITWSFNAKKEEHTLVDELVSLLNGFGFSPRLYVPRSNKSVMQVTVCGKLWVKLFHSLCGRWADGKKIHSDLLSGPDEFLEALLQGWLAGDGFWERSWESRKFQTGATVSHDLALNMYDVANSLGLRPVLYRQEPQEKPIFGRASKGTHLPVWKIHIRAKSDNYRVKLENTHVWRRVETLVREPYAGFVYNIEVDVDTSYVAEGIGVHNCVHRTNEQMLQAEFQVFHKMGPGPDDKEEVKPGDPAYQLIDLLEKPNRDDTFGELMARWNQQMDLTGMALTWMVPNMLGVPKELYSVPTAIAIPQPTVNPDYPDGFYRIQPIYPYGPFSSYPTPASAVGAPIPAQWMIKMMYPHPLLRYDGFSPLTALRLHIDEITMMDRSRHYSMRRSINPSAVMNFDAVEGLQPLPEEEIERIHAEWESEYQGPESHGKLIVGTPGSHLEPWGVRPVDMDYQHGWDQLVAFVMAGFGITKPAAGMVEDASYATLFATLKQFHLLTLVPKCQRIAQKLTRHLAPFFGDHLIVEVRPQRIDDHDVMFSKIDRGMAARCITKNQVLRMLDLPVTDESWGDEIAGTEPMMGLPLGQGGQPVMEGQPIDQGNTTLVDRFSMGEEARYGAKPDEKLMQDNEPVPGKLARRGIGPRKSMLPISKILQRRMKSLDIGKKDKKSVEIRSTYDMIRDALCNGSK